MLLLVLILTLPLSVLPTVLLFVLPAFLAVFVFEALRLPLLVPFFLST